MRFTELELSPRLQEAVSRMGFEEATPIQAQAVPHGLAGRDIVGCAQTGTGKTLAFLLPALQRLLTEKKSNRNPRVIMLEPTRELAVQVTAEVRRLARFTPFVAVPIYGGQSIFHDTPHWRDLILFYEYFHGDNGAGLGAMHQTGWTGLVAKLISSRVGNKGYGKVLLRID